MPNYNSQNQIESEKIIKKVMKNKTSATKFTLAVMANVLSVCSLALFLKTSTYSLKPGFGSLTRATKALTTSGNLA